MAQKRPSKPNKRMRQRVSFLIAVFAVLGFVVVAAKLFYMQVINTNFYQSKAAENQTKDLIITPMRGTIYDRNMTELAVSATTQEISVDPSIIRDKGKASVVKRKDANGKTIEPTDEEIAAALETYQKKVASVLAEKLELDFDETLEKIQRDVSYVRIARRVDADIADELMQELDKENLSGVYTTADSKRYYRYGTFASQVIGFTNDDGEGLYGIELQYNDVLKGVAGRVVKATNALGSDMPYDYEKYVPEQDGDGVVLSLDEGVQHYLEKHLEEALNDYQAKKGVCGIVMDIKTGEILAMSTKPDFDLNNPRTIPEEYTALLAELDNLSGEEYSSKYSEILLRLWRNKAINDTYEPGSTFKVFTVSSALEAGVVQDSSTFTCGGSKVVKDRTIRCWKSGGHGTQVLGQTLENSCNVAMMDISALLGTDMFRKFFEAYGLMEKTGIDLPGEATGIFFDDTMGEVDLATASFGQNFQVTPIQELCMVAAACNGGDLVTPHVAKEIVDTDGNVKQTISTEVKRQVISEETSSLIRTYLENVVSQGTGQNAYVAGYRVGGKTATSQKQPKSDDSLRIASFIGVAPMDDPQYAVLVMIDEPQTSVKGGGALAAPTVGRIFEDILPYLGVEAIYSEDETDRQEITIPSLVGKSVEDAQAALEELGLECRIKGDGDTVTDQLPVAGISLQPDNKVVLYCGESRPTDKVEVPDVSGMSIEAARQQLADYGLYMKQNGIADWRANIASVAMQQSPAAGSKVSPGSVVTVAFGNAVTSQE
ncbi:penicillin-binding transpeptidase domain-containing protein [Butyricicoccus sp.]|uniref:penicillin-binding transpeptidase domain-containing protein n=1 Tax=Butyricicoccus sp. TaxID=2049021 RepID=UPI003F170F05